VLALHHRHKKSKATINQSISPPLVIKKLSSTRVLFCDQALCIWCHEQIRPSFSSSCGAQFLNKIIVQISHLLYSFIPRVNTCCKIKLEIIPYLFLWTRHGDPLVVCLGRCRPAHESWRCRWWTGGGEGRHHACGSSRSRHCRKKLGI